MHNNISNASYLTFFSFINVFTQVGEISRQGVCAIL